jgi:hypothetical protein
VADNILAKHPKANLAVYTVWLPELGGSRGAWDPSVLPDHRVVNYWDGDELVALWYAAHVADRPGIVWDAFFLYGPAARWRSVPGPLVAGGGTVIDESGRLADAIRPLLATT